jgi:hypothetical protein
MVKFSLYFKSTHLLNFCLRILSNFRKTSLTTEINNFKQIFLTFWSYEKQILLPVYYILILWEADSATSVLHFDPMRSRFCYQCITFWSYEKQILLPVYYILILWEADSATISLLSRQLNFQILMLKIWNLTILSGEIS